MYFRYLAIKMDYTSVGQTMVFFAFLENFHFCEQFFKNGNFFPKMGMQNDTSNFNSILTLNGK